MNQMRLRSANIHGQNNQCQQLQETMLTLVIHLHVKNI